MQYLVCILNLNRPISASFSLSDDQISRMGTFSAKRKAIMWWHCDSPDDKMAKSLLKFHISFQYICRKHTNYWSFGVQAEYSHQFFCAPRAHFMFWPFTLNQKL